MKSLRLQVATFPLIVYVAILLVITAGFFADSEFLIRNSLSVSLLLSSLAFVGYAKLIGESVVNAVKSAAIALGIIACSLFLASMVYDISYDGQSYHSQAILNIANGWNPFKENLSSTITNSIYIQHYSKGYSYAASSIYMQLGLFEGAKALNLLLIISSFLIVLELLESFASSIKPITRYLIAILLACNPLTVFEAFTFYVDGQVSSGCLILFCSFFLYKKDWKIAAIIGSCALIILANLKFTSLVYAAIICTYGFVFLLIHKKSYLRQYCTVSAVAVLIALCWIGYNPYIRNATEESHVFYPLMGKGAVNIMTGTNAPVSFAKKGSLQKIFEANFSRSKNVHNSNVGPEPELKVPFTFKMKEWIVFKSHGVIMGGFGPLWSGILILTVVFVLIGLLKYNRIPQLNRDFCLLILTLLGLMLINPEGWYSRYVPFFWFIPVLAVLFLVYQNPKLSNVLAYIMVINLAGTSLISLASDVIITDEIKTELTWLKQQKGVRVSFNAFEANKARMINHELPFDEVISSSITGAANLDSLLIQNSNTVVYFNATPLRYTPGSLFNLLAGYAKNSIHGKK